MALRLLTRPVAPGALAGQVVVVTGASAGVGRAVAREVAVAGASVALIARSETALREVAEELETLGARAVIAPLDVADAQAVADAADYVERELGPIDIWVNAAMATVFSPVSRLPADEVRRVTEVTYLGSVNGILAVLPAMRQRGRGTIVQVGSALAYRGIPLQAPYCAAKHAIRGFIGSLRAELIHERSPVRITEVHLPAVNTPQFTWARTHLPEQPKPVGRIFSPEAAAQGIVAAALHPEQDYWMGRSTAQAILGQAVAPKLLDHMMARQAWEGQFTGEPGEERAGNLYETVEGMHAVRGPFRDEANARAVIVPGAWTRLATVALGALAAGAAAGALGYLAGRRRAV